MRIGVFADTHDHLDNIRRVVDLFNQADCELAVFAGDFVSTIALPPLRSLRCPLVACFGDNEGNRPGLLAGSRILGILGEPPFGFRAADGTRIVVAHMLRQLRGADGEQDVVIHAHTHRPAIHRDDAGCLYVNPGETSGWTYRQPSVAILETRPLRAEVVYLNHACTPPDLC